MAAAREAAADGQPVEKRRKAGEVTEHGGEAAAEDPEQAVPTEEELGRDAPASKAATIKEPVEFHTRDMTLNILPGTVSGFLKTISDGSFQHLFGGARGSVGLKAGRYMFDVELVEFVSPVQDTGSRASQARQVFRLGFSLGGRSSLFIGDTEDSICFDRDGFFTYNKRHTLVMQRVGRGSVLAVVNLEEGSANADTVSLFRDGVRVCQPQPLPDALKGKRLFPAVTLTNVTAFVNFGPAPLTPLPFSCRCVQDADQKHAVVTSAQEPKGGNHDVLFPVCLPDEGAFDWADLFLEKNPDFTVLSDRMILDWAEKSGLWLQKGVASSSLDKPEAAFNLPFLDDGSVRHILQQAITLEMEAMLMNSMALGFVLDIDELLFCALLPRLTKALISIISPVHLPPSRGFLGADVVSIAAN